MDKSNKNSLFTCDACGASIETSKCRYCRAINQSLWEKEEAERIAKEKQQQADINDQELIDIVFYCIAVLAFLWFLGSFSLGYFLHSILPALIGIGFVALAITRKNKRNKNK